MPILFSMTGLMVLIPVIFAASPSDQPLEGIDGQEILTLLLGMILLLLAIIPGILPSIIASYSFVGEKMNRSMEPLLATPTTDDELLLGKSLAAFIPTMAGTYIAFAINIMAIDWLLFPIVGRLLLPDLSWVIVMVFVAPAICITAIEANVLVSSRMRDIRAAQQVGVVVITPIMLLMFASIANIFPITPLNMLILSAVFGGIAFGLFQVSRRLFQREKILTQWK
jgi:ABC-2 type transport system permease protein